MLVYEQLLLMNPRIGMFVYKLQFNTTDIATSRVCPHLLSGSLRHRTLSTIIPVFLVWWNSTPAQTAASTPNPMGLTGLRLHS